MSNEQTTISFYGEDILAVLELEPNETYAGGRAVPGAGLPRAAAGAPERAHTLLAAAARTLDVEDDTGTMRALRLPAHMLPLWLAGVEFWLRAARAAAQARPVPARGGLGAVAELPAGGLRPEDAPRPSATSSRPPSGPTAAALTQATLARHQMLIERQLDRRASYDEADPFGAGGGVDDPQAELTARAVRRGAGRAGAHPPQ